MKVCFVTNKYRSRRGYSVSKRLVKLTRFQDFPSQLPGYQDLPPLSFVLSYYLNTLFGCSSVQDQLKTASQ